MNIRVSAYNTNVHALHSWHSCFYFCIKTNSNSIYLVVVNSWRPLAGNWSCISNKYKSLHRFEFAIVIMSYMRTRDYSLYSHSSTCWQLNASFFNLEILITHLSPQEAVTVDAATVCCFHIPVLFGNSPPPPQIPSKHPRSQAEVLVWIFPGIFLYMPLIYESCWQLGDISLCLSSQLPPPLFTSSLHLPQECDIVQGCVSTIYSGSPWWHSYLYVPCGQRWETGWSGAAGYDSLRLGLKLCLCAWVCISYWMWSC